MKNLREYKHLFFDLDDTLTLSKSPIKPEMKAILESSACDIIVVSGAETGRIQEQISHLKSFKLGQNGNHAVDVQGALLWKEDMTQIEKDAVMKHISELLQGVTWNVKDESDLIEDRGCQISYSIIGHHEDVPYKKSFDPHSHIRLALLERFPFNSQTVEVKIGGTTTYDYFKKGFHKGSNVMKLIEHMGWNKDDCVYFGDKLHPGGNDEAVIGVIDTVAVTDCDDTYSKLSTAFTV